MSHLEVLHGQQFVSQVLDSPENRDSLRALLLGLLVSALLGGGQLLNQLSSELLLLRDGQVGGGVVLLAFSGRLRRYSRWISQRLWAGLLVAL